MQYEAVMCPMTVYELGKTQKLGNEMKFQLESSNVVNAQLMAEKARLESALAVGASHMNQFSQLLSLHISFGNGYHY